MGEPVSEPQAAEWTGGYPWDDWFDGAWHDYTEGVSWGCGYSKGAALRVGRQMAQRRGGWLEHEHTGPATLRARFRADAGA